MAICGMQSIGLTRAAMNILGIYFSCNMNLMNQKNDCQVYYQYSLHFKTLLDGQSFY